MNFEGLQKEKERPIRRSFWTVLRRASNLKCLILTFLIHGCLYAIIWCRNTQVTKILLNFDAFPITRTRQVSPCDDGYVYIPTAFLIMLYLLYLVECWHSNARIQISLPKEDVRSVYERICGMREAQPMIWWRAVSYHYVRRVRQVTRYRNGASYTTSQVFYERVNSSSVASYFYYSLCGMRDASKTLVDLEKFPSIKIKFTKGFIFANSATAAEFEEQRSLFFQEQQGIDDYLEMRESLDLSNVEFKDNVTAWATPDALPWYARPKVFWIFSFLLLSWPIRIMLELNTAHLNYKITKLFGVNYPPSSDLTPFFRHSPLNSNYLSSELKNIPRRRPTQFNHNYVKRAKKSTPIVSSQQGRNRRSIETQIEKINQITSFPRSITSFLVESQNELDLEDGSNIPTYAQALILIDQCKISKCSRRLISPPSNLYEQTSASSFGGEDGGIFPPSYVEALHTSRPVFLPPFTSLRRCFTERELSGRVPSRDNEKKREKNWINMTKNPIFIQRLRGKSRADPNSFQNLDETNLKRNYSDERKEEEHSSDP